MNNLKFRAWDKEYERMFSNEELKEYGESLVSVSNNWMLQYNKEASISPTGIFLPTGDSNMTFMQYTGENPASMGVELYEHDIVKIEFEALDPRCREYGQVYVGIIEYLESCFCIVNHKRQQALYLWDDQAAITLLGNEHQNPELMEEIE